jgi:hypothetical protein
MQARANGAYGLTLERGELFVGEAGGRVQDDERRVSGLQSIKGVAQLDAHPSRRVIQRLQPLEKTQPPAPRPQHIDRCALSDPVEQPSGLFTQPTLAPVPMHADICQLTHVLRLALVSTDMSRKTPEVGEGLNVEALERALG